MKRQIGYAISERFLRLRICIYNNIIKTLKEVKKYDLKFQNENIEIGL